MVIALTDKDKIYGGYTHLSFNQDTDQYIPDHTKQSFLFSIS